VHRAVQLARRRVEVADQAPQGNRRHTGRVLRAGTLALLNCSSDLRWTKSQAVSSPRSSAVRQSCPTPLLPALQRLPASVRLTRKSRRLKAMSCASRPPRPASTRRRIHRSRYGDRRADDDQYSSRVTTHSHDDDDGLAKQFSLSCPLWTSEMRIGHEKLEPTTFTTT
jgi:hypothetical protein